MEKMNLFDDNGTMGETKMHVGLDEKRYMHIFLKEDRLEELKDLISKINPTDIWRFACHIKEEDDLIKFISCVPMNVIKDEIEGIYGELESDCDFRELYVKEIRSLESARLHRKEREQIAIQRFKDKINKCKPNHINTDDLVSNMAEVFGSVYSDINFDDIRARLYSKAKNIVKELNNYIIQTDANLTYIDIQTMTVESYKLLCSSVIADRISDLVNGDLSEKDVANLLTLWCAPGASKDMYIVQAESNKEYLYKMFNLQWNNREEQSCSDLKELVQVLDDFVDAVIKEVDRQRLKRN